MRRLLKKVLYATLMAMLLCPGARALQTSGTYDDFSAACRDVRAAMYSRQTHVAFSLTPTAVAGRSTDVLRDILTDVLESCVDYTIAFDTQGDLLHVTIDGTLRPAVNILHAWETGDRSFLTEDENRVMEIALEIAENCRRGAKNAIEIERRVYDEVCRLVAYNRNEPAPIFGSSEYIRRHTSVGALLDGATQCLGYSEVFYLIGRLAGLNVEMQYGFPGGGIGGKHAWNIVTVGAQRYMVDVCWGDTSADIFERTTPDYRNFNVAKDLMPKDRYAHPEADIALISETTDMQHSAFAAGNGGARVKSLEEAIAYALEQHRAGQPYAHALIEDKDIRLEDIDSAMWARVKEEGITTTWGRMPYSFAGGTYVIFRWVLE